MLHATREDGARRVEEARRAAAEEYTTKMRAEALQAAQANGQNGQGLQRSEHGQRAVDQHRALEQRAAETRPQVRPFLFR